jgi:hypothetical protein
VRACWWRVCSNVVAGPCEQGGGARAAPGASAPEPHAHRHGPEGPLDSRGPSSPPHRCSASRRRAPTVQHVAPPVYISLSLSSWRTLAQPHARLPCLSLPSRFYSWPACVRVRSSLGCPAVALLRQGRQARALAALSRKLEVGMKQCDVRVVPWCTSDRTCCSLPCFHNRMSGKRTPSARTSSRGVWANDVAHVWKQGERGQSTALDDRGYSCAKQGCNDLHHALTHTAPLEHETQSCTTSDARGPARLPLLTPHHVGPCCLG